MKLQITKKLGFLVLIFLFLFSVNNIRGQNKHMFSLNYGIGGNTILVNGFDKKKGFSNDGMYNIGVRYQRNFSNTIAFKIGLDYCRNDVLVAESYHPYHPEDKEQSWDIKILSMPVFINYRFFNYLFLEGGLLLDYQFGIWDCQPTDDQTGFGIGLGIGGIYQYKRFSFTLNPYLNFHSVIAVDFESGDRLLEMGIKLGVGYHFN